VTAEDGVATLNERGYAVVTVDARGTGASFGTINILFGDKEVSDYGAVADWITGQPWSNGKVGAYGFSCRGMTAANIASLPKASIKAVAPLFARIRHCKEGLGRRGARIGAFTLPLADEAYGTRVTRSGIVSLYVSVTISVNTSGTAKSERCYT
jgi:predicted acyl esterase